MNANSKSESIIYPYHVDIVGRSRVPFSNVDPAFVDYRRRWEENPKRQITGEFPLHLDIEVTARCNLMCRHCFRFSRRTDIGDMDFELFRGILDEGAAKGLCAVNLCWMGESFLHPQIIDMMKYAKSTGVLQVIVNTNATLVDEDIAREIIESECLDTIVFSLDSVTPEMYNRIKYGSDFAMVHRNVERFIEIKNRSDRPAPVVIVQMIDQEQAHEELLSFVHYWVTRADLVRLATYQSPDGKPDDKRRSCNSPDVIFPCTQLWQRMAIAWNGEIFPCSGDNACRNPLGTFPDMSISDAWLCERMEMLRKHHADYDVDGIPMCVHCDLNKIPATYSRYIEGLKNNDNK